MRKIIIMLSLLFITGCAPFMATVKDISQSPEGFKTEASTQKDAVKIIFPDTIPTPAAVGAGYLLAFLRRLYINWRKKKNV